MIWRLEKQDTQPAYRSFAQSLGFALAGVRFDLCNEPNMRIHVKCLAWPNQLSLTETICSQAASKSMKCDQ
jgi:diacylglycerol kinase